MGTRTYHAFLVGMRFFNPPFDVFAQLYWSTPELEHEPHNPHDSNAVAVWLRGHKVGYLNKESAMSVSKLLQEGVAFDVEAVRQSARTIKLKLKASGNIPFARAPKLYPGKACGIYKISINFDQFVYIGQSNDINKRIKIHWTELAANAHCNYNLQYQWNELGESLFAAEIVEFAPEDLPEGLGLQRWLGDREAYWVEEYRGSTTCLNILAGEVVATKKALKELANEEKQHDKKVKEERAIIDKQLNTVKGERNLAIIASNGLRQKIKQNEAFIFKNSGVVGVFFGGRSKSEVEQKRSETESLRNECDSISKKSDQLLSKINNLEEERSKLKTLRQIDTLLRKCGITPSRDRKKIY